MLYGAPQPGFNGYPDQGLNIASLIPGEAYTLLDGTEASGIGTSVAVARGPSGGQSQAYTTFYVSGGSSMDTVIIQGSNTDIDGDYADIADITLDTNGNGSLTDSGSPAFYRCKKSAGQPIVKAQR